MFLALITDPIHLLAFLMALLALLFWVSTFEALKKLFDTIPPVIWAYFLPMLCTSFQIIPSENELYKWSSKYLLPYALFLLMLSIDFPAVLKLGRKSLIVMLAGSLGTMLGAMISFVIFGAFLSPDAWKEFAALTGSWIGGSVNMYAIAQSLSTPEKPLDMSVIIVVDTLVGYGWMGILLFLAKYQDVFNQKTQADNTIVTEINAQLAEMQDQRRPSDTLDFIKIIGLGFALTIALISLGRMLPELGTVISKTTWAILLVSTAGLALSFTKARELEYAGASKMGYFVLYFLLTTIGAQGDITKVAETPLYILAGVVWMSIHIGILFLVGRLVRAPLFMIATASMANVGGVASAPVVAGVYQPAMAPVGVLMAILGYAVGTYGGIVVSVILSYLDQMF